jgi:hypothetical protein
MLDYQRPSLGPPQCIVTILMSLLRCCSFVQINVNLNMLPNYSFIVNFRGGDNKISHFGLSYYIVCCLEALAFAIIDKNITPNSSSGQVLAFYNNQRV